MGFFSWKTADTKESIANKYSSRPCQTVYVLQPGGAEPIEEHAYEGYGEFGGQDVHMLIAKMNMDPKKLENLTDDEIRTIGIELECGSYYVDTQTNKKWSIFSGGAKLIDPTINQFSGSYDTVIPELGDTGNNLIKSGRLERKEFHVDFPLKFSFSKDAVYEDLEASESCENQGYFYDDEEEVDEEESWDEEEELEDYDLEEDEDV